MAIDLNSVWSGWMTILAQGSICLTLGLLALGALSSLCADRNRAVHRNLTPARRTELRAKHRAA